MKVFAVFMSLALIAAVSAQGDIMRQFMMMRMLGLGGESGGSTGTTSSGGQGQSASSGLSALYGGRGMGMMNPLFLMGGSDRMRDMMMCNMMQGTMRMMCLTRAFQ